MIRSAYSLAVSGEILPHLGASLAVVVAGFGLAAVAGFALALVLYSLPAASRRVLPAVDALRTISAIALMPAVIVLVGLGFAAKALVIFWTAWPAVLVNTMHGLASVDADVRGAARLDGCGTWSLLRVLVPAAALTIAAGLRLAVGGAWISLVAAEMLGSNSGLGFLVLAKSQAFDFPGMWAAVAFIGGTGLFMNGSMNLISWRFDDEKMDSRWTGISHASDSARAGRHSFSVR